MMLCTRHTSTSPQKGPAGRRIKGIQPPKGITTSSPGCIRRGPMPRSPSFALNNEYLRSILEHLERKRPTRQAVSSLAIDRRNSSCLGQYMPYNHPNVLTVVTNPEPEIAYQCLYPMSLSKLRSTPCSDVEARKAVLADLDYPLDF
jgi:hypothetical protein